MRGIIAITLVCLLPTMVTAQQDDRDYLTAFLEDNLSDAGRQVTITGFAGALSSRATIERMTIADAEGVWITLTDITLDWSRSALLSGELMVDELTAATIMIDRAPIVGESDMPTPEAMPFALPELPVSVAIGRIAADTITLGAALLGQPVEGRLEASANLARGEGVADIVLERTDGTLGTLSLDARYSNATRALAVNLLAVEDAGGLAVTVLGLPGKPSARLQIAGTGTLDDFTAEVSLRTDDVDRLVGAVSIAQDADGTRGFAATLTGNVAPLFVPNYAEFFGDKVDLRLAGAVQTTGAVSLSQFQIDTAALDLDGTLSLAPDGLPERIELTGKLATEDGTPVLLPIESGPPTRINRADLTLRFDAKEGPDWGAAVIVTGLDRDDFHADLLTLTGSGLIARNAGGRQFDANFDYAAEGLRPADAALAAALGPGVAGNAVLSWREGADTLSIPQATLAGQGFDAEGAVEVAGLSTGLTTTGRVTVTADDFARLSGLAGRRLSGSGTISLDGALTPLGGAFDGKLGFVGTDLTVGIAEIDTLLRGTSEIAGDVRRDETGLTIRDLTVQAASLTSRLSGTVATDRIDLQADFALADLAALGGAYRGALTARAAFAGTPEAGTVTLAGDGAGLGIGIPAVDNLLRGPSKVTASAQLRDGGLDLTEATFSAATLDATVAGRIDPDGHLLTAELQFPDLSVLGGGYRGALTTKVGFAGTTDEGQITVAGQGRDLALGQAEADRLLAGTSTVSAVLRVSGGMIQIDRATVQNPQITGSATGQVSGTTRNVALNLRLGNMGVLLPAFPGALTVAGDVVQTAAGTTLDLRAEGPGGIAATVTGQVAPDYRTARLDMAGRAQAAVLNAVIDPGNLSGVLDFDVALNGPWQASSVSGQVALREGRYASPALPFALDGIQADSTITSGRATIAADAVISTGGRMTARGTVGTVAPHVADVTIDLAGFVLRDPQLFQTRGNGTITLQGPLDGGATIAGRVALIETEIRVPAGSFVAVGAVPGLIHINEPAAVRQTRVFAGLLGDGTAEGGRSGGRIHALNLEISAPNRVFIRGRGLDAELGGTLRLQGTTANVVPAGAFNLIRGRLDILGKRLALSEAELRLEGDFIPSVRILASNESDGITSSVLVEGRVSDPRVSFTSNPELPEEEVLSRLLFGRALNTLSAFQAAQLASAVATLAGRGGEGLLAKLRRGFGLDDLDITTAEDGTTSLTAGKYISRNTYTEVEVDQQGRSEISLNLDLTDNLTIRGRVDSEGETGIGIFLEKDY